MLETIFAKFVTKYLKEYIKTINKSQMEMELWKGHADFNNLTILESALSHHQLPFRVRMGTVGHVKIHFPWKKLNQEACILEVENVFIIANLDPDVLIKKDLQAHQDAIHVDSQKEISKEDEKGTWQSIINTCIDNARVTIRNIHIRIEVAREYDQFAIGLCIPELTLNTVDNNNNPLPKVQRALVLRKRLLLTDLSVYFDTGIPAIDISNFNSTMYQILISRQHQYLLTPFTADCILIHSRHKDPNVLKNVLTIVTQQLQINLDFSQCRSLLHLNEEWNMFSKKRKYAHCARPKVRQEESDWKYSFRCAYAKTHPHVFNPRLALLILKNRNEYIKLYRKKKKGGKINLHPIVKQKLKAIDKKVGPNAALFLKEYAEAFTTKELQASEDTITAFDLSEIKGIIDSTDLFFAKDSFQVDFTIPDMKFGLNYAAEAPLLNLGFFEISTKILSMAGGAKIKFNITDMSMVSYIGDQMRSIIHVDRSDDQAFFDVNTVIPSTADPFKMDVVISPITTTIDGETIKNLMDFVQVKQVKRTIDLDEPAVEDTLIDVADQLNSLIYFKNHALTVTMKKFNFVFPFKQNGQDMAMTFAVSDILIEKASKGLIPLDAVEIPMQFALRFSIDDFMVADHCMFHKFPFDMTIFLKFKTNTEIVELEGVTKLGNAIFQINNENLSLVSAALNYTGELDIIPTSGAQPVVPVQQKPQPKTIIMLEKLKTTFTAHMKEASLIFNESTVSLNDISLLTRILNGEVNATVKVLKMKFTQNDNILLELVQPNSECCRIHMTQKNEKSPKNIVFQIIRPSFNLNIDWIKDIMKSLTNIMDQFKTSSDQLLTNIPKTNDDDEEKKPLPPPPPVPNDGPPTEMSFEIIESVLDIPDDIGHIVIEPKTIRYSPTDDGFIVSLIDTNITRGDHRIARKSVIQVVSDEKGTRIESPVFNAELDYKDYFALMRFLDKIMAFLDEEEKNNKVEEVKDAEKKKEEVEKPKEEETEEKEEEPSHFLVTINNVNVKAFDYADTAAILKMRTLIVDSCSTKDQSVLTVTLCSLSGTQFINGKQIHLISLDEDMVIKMISTEKQRLLDVEIGEGNIFLTNYIYNYLMKFIDEEDADKPPIDNEEETQHEQEEQNHREEIYTIRLNGVRAHFIQMKTLVDAFSLITSEAEIKLTYPEKELHVEINAQPMKADSTVLGDFRKWADFREPLNLIYYKDVLSVKTEDIGLSFHVPFLLNAISAFTEILSSDAPAPDQDTGMTWGYMGFDIDIPNISIDFLPENLYGPHSYFQLEQTRLKVLAHQKIGFVQLKAVNMMVNNAIPATSMIINDIALVIAFSNEVDPYKYSIEDIIKLEHDVPQEYPLRDIKFVGGLKSIEINYSHTFAHAIISCFLESAINDDNPMCFPEVDDVEEYSEEESEEEDKKEEEEKREEEEEEEKKEEEIVENDVFSTALPSLSINPFLQTMDSIESDSESEKEEEIDNTTPSNDTPTPRVNIESPIGSGIPKMSGFTPIKKLELNGRRARTLSQPPEKKRHRSSIVDPPPLHRSPSDGQIQVPEEQTIRFHVNAHIDTIEIFLYLISPIAELKFTDVSGSYEDHWKAYMQSFEIFDPENPGKSLVESPKDSKLVVFEMDKRKINISFVEISFFFDYIFTIKVFNYVMRSPFFNMPATPETAPPVEKDQTPGQAPVSNVPFILLFKAPILIITIPTDISVKDTPLFIVRLNAMLQVAGPTLELGIGDLSVHFVDQITHTHYPPLFSELSITFVRRVLSSSNDSINILIAPLYMTLSAGDLVLFNQISSSITQATSLIVIGDTDKSEEVDKTQKYAKITDIKFQSDETNIILCKDNRSSSRYLPLFEIVIPPIGFRLSSTENVGSMILEINPYIQYYNEISGQWDLIIEPFMLKILGMTTQEQFNVRLVSENDININLPMNAITQFMNYQEIITQHKNQSGINYTELPNFWIENALGSDVSFTLDAQQGNGEQSFFALGTGQQIPIFSIDMNTSITFKYNNAEVTFSPKQLTYPTMLTPHVLVCRKPYKGGLIIILMSPLQLENLLSIPIDFFTRNHPKEAFKLISTVQPQERIPLFLNPGPAHEFLFTEHKSNSKFKHQVVELSPTVKGSFFIPFGFNNKMSKLLISVSHDISTASKVISLLSPVTAVSLLPLPLHLKFDDTPHNEDITISPDSAIDLLNVLPNAGKIVISLSLDAMNYPKPTTIKIKPNKIESVPIYNHMIEKSMNIAAAFEQDEDTGRMSIIFFSPAVFFNMTPNVLLISEVNTKTPIEYSVTKNGFQLWCPPKYFQDNDHLDVNIRFPGLTNAWEKPFDCLTTTRGNMLLPLPLDSGLYHGVRTDVSNKSRISVITFTPLLTIKNELPYTITLQPISKIPKAFSETLDILPNDSILPDIRVIEPKQSMPITVMSESGAFLLTVEGYITTPSLSLTSPQKTVFRVINKTDYYLVELEIFDIQTTLQATIRPATFPTPFIISNCLPVPMTVYQIVKGSPFFIEEESTSIFAMDEPFAYPCVHIDFEDVHLNISLIEDTDPINLNRQFDGYDIYCEIHRNTNGTRSVIITQDIEKEIPNFQTAFSMAFSSIHISIIDMAMREFALLQLGNFAANLIIKDLNYILKLQIETLQLDDQNPHASSPIVILGRTVKRHPFLRFECVMPSDTQMFTNFSYVSANIQRMDVVLDSAMLSDIYYLIDEVFQSTPQEIAPLMPAPNIHTGKLINLNWLELSPLFINLTYNRKTTRPTTIKPMMKYFKYIPGIKDGKMLLPGLVLAQQFDHASEIKSKISGEYKTAAFKKLIALLGRSGKMLSAFGVTATIAQMFDIKMESDLTNEINQFYRHESEEFDNRREHRGAFSHQTLESITSLIQNSELHRSNVIVGLEQGVDTGLMTKPSGDGVVGVLMKTGNDILTNVPIMANAHHTRPSRAFPNNKIDRFDLLLSEALTIIQTQYVSEKIRVTATDQKSNDVLIITDSYVYLFTNKLEVKIQFNIMEIKGLEVIDRTLSIGVKNITIHFVCETIDVANRLQLFIISQQSVNVMFGQSLLL